jgi:hypothetical protein
MINTNNLSGGPDQTLYRLATPHRTIYRAGPAGYCPAPAGQRPAWHVVIPLRVRPAGRRDRAAVDLLDGTFANSIVLRLIGEGHSPGPEGDYVSLAMRPGPLCLLQLHTPGTIRHRGGTGAFRLTRTGPWSGRSHPAALRHEWEQAAKGVAARILTEDPEPRPSTANPDSTRPKVP